MSLNVLWYILSNIFLSMRWIALFKASFYLSPQQPRLFFFFFIRQFFFLHKMYKSFHYNSRTIKMFGINIFSFNLITHFSFTFLIFFLYYLINLLRNFSFCLWNVCWNNLAIDSFLINIIKIDYYENGYYK